MESLDYMPERKVAWVSVYGLYSRNDSVESEQVGVLSNQTDLIY